MLLPIRYLLSVKVVGNGVLVLPLHKVCWSYIETERGNAQFGGPILRSVCVTELVTNSKYVQQAGLMYII